MRHRVSSGRNLVGINAAAAAVFLFCLAAPVAEAAADPVTEYLPGASQFVVHVDAGGLRNSDHFDRAVELLEDRADEGAAVPSFLDDSGDFDARSDLDTVAIGLPVSRISPYGSVRRATVAAAGEFEQAQVRAMLKEEYDELDSRTLDGGTKVFETDDRSFVIPTKGRLVAVVGPASYRNNTLRLVDEGGTSFADVADNQGLLDGIDTGRTVWMVDRQPSPMAIGIELASGLDLHAVVREDSEAAAKATIQQLEAMKKSGTGDSLLEAYGAAPLVDNLDANRSGSTVDANTSMTASEFETLIDRIASSGLTPSAGDSSEGDTD